MIKFEHTGPLFYLVGETFDGDRGLINSFIGPHALNAQFDFPIYFNVINTLATYSNSLRDLESATAASDAAFGDAPMSPFLGNHDVARFLSTAAGMLTGDPQGEAWSAPPAAPATEDAYFKQRLALTFVATSPGVPLVYYGDEYGQPGAGDPDNRRFMKWARLLGVRAVDARRDQEARRRARGAGRRLQRGDRKTLWIDDDHYVFARTTTDNEGGAGGPQSQLRRHLDAGGAGAVVRAARRRNGAARSPRRARRDRDRRDDSASRKARTRAPCWRHERARSRLQRVHVLALATSIVCMSAAPATAQQRTWNFLTTGNGYGFQVFDTNANKITQFLEHPYRYLRPSPSDPHAEGVVRRNLAFDFYFGVRGGGTSGWLNAPTSAGDPGYVDESHIIRAPATLGSVTAESYFFAPFDFPGNAMVALLKAPGASDGFVLFNFHMGTATTPDSPGNDGESVRLVAANKAVVETGPGGGFLVYVPLSGVDNADCCERLLEGDGGHGSGAEHVVQRHRRRARLPEEARRQRLDGRRRHLRRQHQPRRCRRRRGGDDDVGQQPRARSAARRRAHRVRDLAQAAAGDGAAVRRLRDARCGASPKRCCAWGRFASRTRRRARTTA